MLGDGVVRKYAVGGAMATLFYIEPDTTFDLDIFCVLNSESGSGLDLLSPIYDYLTRKKYLPDRETVIIEGLPVQFLPVFNALSEEAVERAIVIPYRETPVWVMTPEHLVAIMLQTGRLKDYVRISRFLEAGILDTESLTDIFSRHNLTDQWEKFKQRLEA